MSKLIRNLQSNTITNTGISLSLIGVPLGMYFNFIFPVIPWSPFFMILSILMIASYKNILTRQFPSFNKIFVQIILFQILMLIYGFLSENAIDAQYISFHLYIISLIFVLSSNSKNINFDKVVSTIFLLSSLCTILGFYYLRSGIVTSEDDWELRQTEAYTLDPFTIASGAITNFICSLFLIQKKNKIKYLLWIFLILDILVIFMSTKRTPFFITLLIFLSFVYKMRSINKKMFVKYFKFFFAILIIVAFLFVFSGIFREALVIFYTDFYNGFLNILGDTEVKDISGSAILRYEARLWTYNYIENNFSFFNYIFGAGYMTRWIDNPILQSFLDMGIIGAILYIRFVIIYPLKKYLKPVSNIVLFAVLICVYNVFSSYSSGNPYMYIKYVPIVFLAFVVNLKSTRENYFTST